MYDSVSSKRHTCQFVDILNPSGPYPPKMLKPSKARLADAFIQPLSQFMTGFRALDATAHWIFPNVDVPQSMKKSRLAIRRELSWPGQVEVSLSLPSISPENRYLPSTGTICKISRSMSLFVSASWRK